MKPSENLPMARDRGRSLPRPFDLLHTQIDSLFNDFSRSFGMPQLWEGPSEREGNGLIPSIEMHETDNKVMIAAELPGVEEKDIDISVDGDMLTISGEKKSAVEHKSSDTFRSERSYGRFSRTIGLPFTIAAENVDARFENGVLKLSLDKPAEAQQNVKKIPIRH